MVLERLQHVCNSLVEDAKLSARAVLNATNEIEDCLSCEEVCSMLTLNSQSKESYSWGKLFSDVEGVYFKANERSRDNATRTAEKALFGIVKSVFYKATSSSGYPWISWNKIYQFITRCLDLPRLVKDFGTELLELLYDFLSVELYSSLLAPDSWKEIIERLLTLQNQSSYPKLASKCLSCLNVAVYHGSHVPELIPVIRFKVTTFFYEKFEGSDWKLHTELIIKGATTLCKENALEFRGILCKFGEAVIPKLIHSSFRESEEIAFLEFLLVQINLHMPCDVPMSSEAFYADDRLLWIQILKSLYQYSAERIEEIASKKTDSLSIPVCLEVFDLLLKLSGKTTKQSMISDFNGSEDDGGEFRAKRVTKYKSFSQILCSICNLHPDESFVWMYYVRSLLTSFPELLESRYEFEKLLEFGLSVLKSKRTDYDEVFQFLITLFEVEKFHIFNEIIFAHCLMLVIRIMAASKQSGPGLNLLNHLLRHYKPQNLSGLLKIYTNKCLRVDVESLGLLRTYLANCTLPTRIPAEASIENSSGNGTGSPQMLIMQWLFSCPKKEILLLPEFSLLAFALCTNRVHRFIQASIESSCTSASVQKNFRWSLSENPEKALVELSFIQPSKKNFPVSHPSVHLASKVEQLDHIFLENTFTEHLLNYLNQKHQGILSDISGKSEKCCIFSIIQCLLNFCLRIKAYSKKLKIPDVEGDFFSKIEQFCESYVLEYFKALSSIVNGDVDVRKMSETLYKAIRKLNVLLGNFDRSIKSWIIKILPVGTIEMLRKVYRSCLHYVLIGEDEEDIFYKNLDLKTNYLKNIFVPLEKEDKIRELPPYAKCKAASFEAMKLLLEISITSEQANCLKIFSDIVQDLTQEPFHVGNDYLFEMCFEVVERFSSSPDPLLFPQITNIMQNLCRYYHCNPKCYIRLWDLLSCLLEPVSSIQEQRRKIMILIGTMFSYLGKSNISCGSNIDAFRSAFNAFEKLAKLDRNLDWSYYRKDGVVKNSPLLDIHKFIYNPSHRVRMRACNLLCNIFLLGNPTLPNPSQSPFTNSPQRVIRDLPMSFSCKRKELFRSMYESLIDAFTVNGTFKEDEISEEGINRTTMALFCITKVIFSYPFTQNSSIFSLFVLIEEKKVDVKLASRAFRAAHPLALKTIQCYSSYVIEKWLKMNYPLKNIPYKLFGSMNLEDFFRAYKEPVCLYYLENDKVKELHDFATSIGSTLTNILKDCFGTIMARVTPGIQPDVIPYLEEAKWDSLNGVYSRLMELLGKRTVESLALDRVNQIILGLIKQIHDPKIADIWNCPEIIFPETERIGYDEEQTISCFKFLSQASDQNDVTIVGSLMQSSPKKVYDILLTLNQRIYEASDVYERFKRLHHFSFFVQLLIDEPDVFFIEVQEFVCHYVTHAYLRLLSFEEMDSKATPFFYRALLYLIYRWVESLTVGRGEQMKIYYATVVNSLVDFTMKHRDLAEMTIRPLDILVKKYVAVFPDCIASLDPFPEGVPLFHEYRTIHGEMKYGMNRQVRDQWTLEDELRNSIEEIHSRINYGGVCSKERVQFIRHLLSSRKLELAELANRVSDKQLKDDVKCDVLYSLVQCLLVVTLNIKEKEEVVLEAARCLGEIGPINLFSIVLHPLKLEKKETKPKQQNLSSVVEAMAKCLSSTDMNVVYTVSHVLSEVFKLDDCSLIALPQLQLKNPRVSGILKPFKTDGPLVKNVCFVDPVILETKLRYIVTLSSVTFDSWVVILTTSLIDSFENQESFLGCLRPLCKINEHFCEEILPYLMYTIVENSRRNPRVGSCVEFFFREFFERFERKLESGIKEQIESIHVNKRALRILLRMIQFMRVQIPPEDMRSSKLYTPWNCNFLINVDYLMAARAAQFCGAYLTSILYLEIHCVKLESLPYDTESTEKEMISTQSSCVVLPNRDVAVCIESLMFKAYLNIGETDATFGCMKYSEPESTKEQLIQEQNWGGLLSVSNSLEDSEGVCYALKKMDCFKSLWIYLQGLLCDKEPRLSHELSEMFYESAWRLSKWDIDLDKPSYLTTDCVYNSFTKTSTFQKFVYSAALASVNKDMFKAKESIERGYNSILHDLKHACLESTQNLYGFMSKFQIIRILEDFSQQAQLSQLENFSFKWKTHHRINASDFKFQESQLSLQSILMSARNLEEQSNLTPFVDDCLQDIIQRAREHGSLNMAENYTKLLSSSQHELKMLNIAKNHWARVNYERARKVLMNLINNTSELGEMYPSLCLQYGEWLSESMSERPSVIIDKYLLKACRSFENRRVQMPKIAKAHFVLAQYSDQQFRNISQYMSSVEFEKKLLHYENAQKELLQSNQMKDADARKSATCLRRHSNIDHEEIQNVFRDRKKFLLLALKHYLRGLAISDDNDLLIFRVVALWLENAADRNDEDTIRKANEIVAKEKVPSHKYIVVLHQLTARMNATKNEKSDALKSILMQCAETHPYHTIPVLLSQSLLHKDKEIMRQTSRAKIEDHVKGAAQLIATLRTELTEIGGLTQKMEALWNALISLAYYHVQDRTFNGTKKLMPASTSLLTLRNLEEVAVPTTHMKVSHSGEYQSCLVGIRSFENTYRLVGGINYPKRICCIGTNGRKYNMLLKGQDDLRQDAIMQQVFGVMNRLLCSENATKSKNLRIRTYKIVPLSQRSGVLEWCENTITFGEYLIGSEENPGAHPKYRPKDISALDCRKKMKEVAECGDSERKLAVYLKICQLFKPVFRHFFFENFKDPCNYFDKRMAYTRSVATNSMVGYILGLGDRHVLNILIDRKTAELIHIDLGVAFEQGKILPTPETIPFRLTRDIVDGMGFPGVEGVFRRTCEMTLEVLRKNCEIILTILEVLLYDPLYIWTLTTDRMKKVQPGEASSKKGNCSQQPLQEQNNSAARVLLRLRNKLKGIEESASSSASLSVPGHVSLLIQQAMDHERLSRLFPGWQPYL